MDEIRKEYTEKTGRHWGDFGGGFYHGYVEYLESALQLARDELEKYKKACDQAADNIEKWIKWGQEDEEKIDTLKAEAARMREAIKGIWKCLHDYYEGGLQAHRGMEQINKIIGKLPVVSPPAAPEKAETCMCPKDVDFVGEILFADGTKKCSRCGKPIAEGEEI